MSTTIGEVNINLRMSLAQFKTDTVAGTKAAADATKEMANEIGYNAGEAKGSLALISEEVGVSIPRHLRTFIADLPGVGAALEAAFSVVAVIALVEVVVKAIEKFEKWRESIEKAAEAGDKVRESTVRMGLEGSEAVDALREKFIQMTQGPVAALSFQLDHVSETLKGMKLADELNKGFKDMDLYIKGALLEFGSGEGADAFKAFKKDLIEILQTQGRPAALEAVVDEIQKANDHIKVLSVSQDGYSRNATISWEKFITNLQAIQATLDKSLSVSAEKRKVDEEQLQLDRVKADEDANKRILEARKALDALLNETQKTLEKDNFTTKYDKEIEGINQLVEKWTDYKVAWEQAHGGISAVANQQLEALRKEVDLLNAEAAAAIDNALKIANQKVGDKLGKEVQGPAPIYSGTKEAEELYKIQHDAAEATKVAGQVYESTRTSAQHYADEVKLLNTLLQQGNIDQATYNRAMEQNRLKYDEVTKGAYALGQSVEQDIKTGALWGSSWKQTLEAIGLEVLQLILKMTLLKNLSAATAPGGGGFWSQLLAGFGGFKAEGGPLDTGKWYIAGEHGPEPVWGGGAGSYAMGYPTVAARSSHESTPAVHNNEFHFHGVTDADSFRKSSSQISAEMAAVLTKHARRNG